MRSRSRTLIGAALAAWFLAFAGAFLIFALSPPGDMGFTAGMDRVSAFLTWQVVAAGISVVCAVAAGRLPPGRTLRTLGFVPLWITGALALALVSLVFFAEIA